MKVLWAGVLSAALLVLGPAGPAAPQAPATIRIGIGPDDDSTPFLYAQAAGLFKKAGLDVELENLPGGAVAAAALAGGSLDIAKGAPASVIEAYVRGIPFTVIGGSSWYDSRNPTLALVVAAKSDVRAPKDLAGRTLGAVTLQDLGTLATFAWLDKYGVDRRALQFVEMPASRALASIEANRAVGMPIYEPILTSDLASGEVRILGYPFDAVGKRFSEGVMYAKLEWVNEHRDVVARVLRVMQAADAYVNAHELETVPLLARYSGADPAVLAKMRRPQRGVAIRPADVQPVIDVLAKYGAIPKAFPAEQIICSCALHP